MLFRSVPIAKYSSNVMESEILMPANVKFEVVDVVTKKFEEEYLGHKEMYEYTEVVLKEVIA